MSVVAILGAGELGGATARALAIRGRIDTIRLIDEMPAVASGKALDLSQAGPIGRSDTAIQGSNDVSSAAGAHVVVIGDRADGAEWAGERGLALLGRLNNFGIFRDSVVVCAGPEGGALMQLAFDELRVSRLRLLGSAPEALAAVARSLVAIEARTAASRVMLTVLGLLPAQVVIPWDDASIDGHSIHSMLTPPQISRVERRMAALWPPGPGALGTAAALFAESAVLGSRRLFSAYLARERDNGTVAPVRAWPVTLGHTGIERVTMPSLTSRERAMLDEP